MSSKYLSNRRKLMVNNIIGGALVIVIFAQLMFFRLLAIMSLAVYPLSIVIPYGVYMIFKYIIDPKSTVLGKIIKVVFTVTYVVISTLFLNLLFSYPHITTDYVVYFLAIPISLIGLAGFLKGLIVDVYSPLFRILNMLIGAVTFLYCSLAIIFPSYNFLLHLVLLLTYLGLNGLVRSALYLSEYGLTLNKVKSFRIVFYIMDNDLTLRRVEESQF
jgi:hypothetical protein